MSREQIVKRANEILNETMNEKVKYKYERKIIYDLIKSSDSEDIEILESMENLYGKIRMLEEENEKYTEIKIKLTELKNQKTRKCEEDDVVHEFLLKDKNDEYYGFFSRESAKQYLDENKEMFAENSEIQIDKIKNIDLQKLVSMSV